MLVGVARAIDIGLVSEVLTAVDDVAVTIVAGVGRELATMLEGVTRAIGVGLVVKMADTFDGVAPTTGMGVGATGAGTA
jgi:hypothetical protein